MASSHHDAVSRVSSRVSQFSHTQRPFRIYHGSTNSTRQSQHSASNTISTADLTRVLSVDKTSKTAVVEPNVSMDQLVHATLAHGLVPLVVMEFPGITAGGGFSGTSGESSSFRHGFFDATVNWIEIVLPTGEVWRASPDKESDDGGELFWAAASAFGTLGVVTMLEIQCRDAKPFVELRYLSTSSMDDAMEVFRSETRNRETEYLDGIAFAKDHIVVCAGRLVDSPPPSSDSSIQHFTRAQDPWFYLHAQRRAPPQSQSQSFTPPTDYIPLPDYLFRFDRGAFWTGRYAFQYFITPFNRITRWILDGFMHTRVMYHALHKSGLADQFLIQDVAVPYASTKTFFEWLDEKQNFGFYPIWLCPLNTGKSCAGGGLMSRNLLEQKRQQGLSTTPPGESKNDDDESNKSPSKSSTTTTKQAPPLPGSSPQPPQAEEPPEKQEPPQDEDQFQETDYLMNFGLWAPSPHPRNSPSFISQNRSLENQVRALGGVKWLYAHAYYSEDEFWSIYDKKEYDRLRAKYGASYLPDLYEKVRVDLSKSKYHPKLEGDGWMRWLGRMVWGVWPVSGLYGVWKAWRGGEYFLKRE